MCTLFRIRQAKNKFTWAITIQIFKSRPMKTWEILKTFKTKKGALDWARRGGLSIEEGFEKARIAKD